MRLDGLLGILIPGRHPVSLGRAPGLALLTSFSGFLDSQILVKHFCLIYQKLKPKEDM